MKKQTIVACAPPRCHCPTLEMDDNTCMVHIKDDYGGSVKMTYSEFSILAQRFLEEV